MAEDKNFGRLQEILGKGHQLRSPSLRADLYRLLTAFLASKNLIALSDGRDFCPFWTARDELEQSEIVRLLVSTAIQIRILEEDFTASYKSQGKQVPASPSTGIWVKNLANPVAEEPLSIREACNKIIHAERINFDRVNARHPTRSYLRPKVYLYSSAKRKVGWRAVLDVPRYFAVAYHLAGG